ncbi:MAG: transcription elongation factor GreA [Acidimicrobiales bacterium]|jgi:transcription elongation factor GreA|nr:transcription elongation factor GreA [Acidimicrobiales bacterium]MDP6297897.1 transcription elongation factor GreA [Acidimicrobiales bacterium]HJM28523.1 transcription elongation factor GreA [Acidimicrobiales bacterium]HJM97541.1 transcription elongation factor GreA [Acidimicrobiales bacterium]
MAQVQKLSQAAFDRLQDEFTLLTTTGRIDIARKIETARELGDLSENGDYHAAKEEQGKMEGRIAHLSSMLEDAEIVDESAGGDSVRAGSIVSIQYIGDDEIEKYLLGSIEERIENTEVVSPSSPLGEALLGNKVDEIVEYDAPGGLLKVKIVAIE